MSHGKSLAQFLKLARTRAGFSQRDVAEHLGYATPQFISNWERGVSAPPISVLKTLAKLYGVEAEEMFQVVLEYEIAITIEDLRRRFKSLR